MGEGTRLAAATGAWICVEDEAGQNLRPPKARTWSRRGRTPVVTVSGKGSGRVSVAGLVCLQQGARGHLFYRMRVHRGRKGERQSMSEADYADLIVAACSQLQAPVIPCWDNLNTHVSAVIRKFTDAHPDRLTVIPLPAYAPDLNLVEGICDAARAASRPAQCRSPAAPCQSSTRRRATRTRSPPWRSLNGDGAG